MAFEADFDLMQSLFPIFFCDLHNRRLCICKKSGKIESDKLHLQVETGEKEGTGSALSPSFVLFSKRAFLLPVFIQLSVL